MSRHITLSLFIIVVYSVSSVAAQDSLSFQGQLADDLGQPLDTTVTMTFRLYKAGSSVWEETQPAVSVVGGVFDVLLGTVTPMDTVAFNQPMELGITVGNNAEISPRTPLAAAAFARALPGMFTYYADDGENEGPNVVGGFSGNTIAADVVGATISGGGGKQESVPVANQANARWATIGGGLSNTAGGAWSTVGGGSHNTASTNSSTVGGGFQNTAGANSATVGGGSFNSAGGNAATIAGGQNNTSAGVSTTVGGGNANTASYFYSTVPGGEGNIASGYDSFAAGHYAKAKHDGTFVWDDRSVSNDSDSLVSTGPNQFLIGAVGGVGINTNAPGHPLQVGNNGDALGNGAHVTSGGAWTNGSSKAFKEDFESVSSAEILTKLAGLDIQSWRYRGSDEGRHIGPTAEDFAAAFATGNDERYIATVDADGVALSAIQGLYELVLEQQRRILELEEALKSLR